MHSYPHSPRAGRWYRIRRFATATDGAVTIDWVALTAFIIAVGMGAAFFVTAAVPELADTVSTHLEETEVSTEIN